MGYPPQGNIPPPNTIDHNVLLNVTANQHHTPTNDTRGRTIVVAASNSLDPTLADPAYRCDGTADQVEINNAITALGATGGAIILLDGTFAITASINLASNVALIGQGAGTVLRVPNGHDADLNVISGNGIDHVLVTNLKVDGNRANQAMVDHRGIYWSAVTHSKIVDCWVENIYGLMGFWPSIVLESSSDFNTIEGCTVKGNTFRGIEIRSSNNNTISGNTCQGNGGGGIAMMTFSNNNTISGNTCQGNGDGIVMETSSNNNAISGNTCQGNTLRGIIISSSNNTITGNTFQGNGQHGIYLAFGANNNTISGNTWLENSQTTDNTYDNIFLDAVEYNLIIGNVCRRGAPANKPRYGINVSNDGCVRNCLIGNDLYDSGSTGDLNDVPTTNPTLKHDNRDLAGTGWLPEV